MDVDPDIASRAQGCLLGQIAGDALGSLVEFKAPQEIRRKFPEWVRELTEDGTWGTTPEEPFGDSETASEMALVLATSLLKNRRYDPEEARNAYVSWLSSRPFGRGGRVLRVLRGELNPDSQGNGALLRTSPLGIFGSKCDPSHVSVWAQQDAALTHPNPVCVQANALFAMAIAHSISTENAAQEIHQQIKAWGAEMKIEVLLMKAITDASESPPSDYFRQQGAVLIAFQNALWQLLHATSLEDGVVNTVMRGGDTDTNASMAGALLGAVHGLEAIPARWREKLSNCSREPGRPQVHDPRPERFWPVDILQFARRLVVGGESRKHRVGTHLES